MRAFPPSPPELVKVAEREYVDREGCLYVVVWDGAVRDSDRVSADLGNSSLSTVARNKPPRRVGLAHWRKTYDTAKRKREWEREYEW